MPDSGTARFASLLVRTQTSAGPAPPLARASAAGSAAIESTYSPWQPRPSATVPADFAHASPEGGAPVRHLVRDFHCPLGLGHHDERDLESLARRGLKLHGVESGSSIAGHADDLARRSPSLAPIADGMPVPSMPSSMMPWYEWAS